jgi:hypothetical protein
MGLDANEIGYFITQVGLSAASFGVATEDVTTVGNALNKAFGYKCSPAVAILPNATAELQAICVASDCPTSPDATCAAYNSSILAPANATGGATATTTGSSIPSISTSNSAMAAVDNRVAGPLAFVLTGVAAVAFAFAL